MLKSLTLAAVTLSALSMSPVPLLGTAMGAQVACTHNRCDTPKYSSTQHCSDQLGHLRRVYEEEVDAVDDPNRVFVIPVCVGDHMMRSDGNAGALLQTIAANDALVEALFQKGYRTEDVVAIRITGDESLNLYVVPFPY